MPLSYLLRDPFRDEAVTLDCPRLKAPPADGVAMPLNHTVVARIRDGSVTLDCPGLREQHGIPAGSG